MALSVREVLSSPSLRGMFSLRPVRQEGPDACGIACLVTVLQHWGQMVIEHQVRDALVPTAGVGMEPTQAMRYLASKHLRCSGWTMYPLDMLYGRCRAGQPTLLRWNDRADHWMLACGMTPDAIVLMDPSIPAGQSCLIALELATFASTWGADEQRIVLTIDRSNRKEVADDQPKRRYFQIEDYVDLQKRVAASNARKAARANAPPEPPPPLEMPAPPTAPARRGRGRG